MATRGTGPELSGRVSGDPSGFVRAMRTAQSALGDLREAGERTGRLVSASLSAISSAAFTVTKGAAAMGAALAATGVAAVASFARFEQAFAQVRTLVDESKVDIKELSDGVRELSRRFGVDAIQATQAAYQAISSGVAPARAIQFLETAFKGAEAGAASLLDVTNLLTSVMSAYGKTVDDVTQLSDVLFVSVREGKTTISQLAESMGRVASIASSAGVSFEESAAAIAALTKAGLGTSEAVTGLRGLIAGIINPSTEAAAALARVGVSAEMLRTKGLGEVMRVIAEETGGATDKLIEFFPSMEALQGAAVLAAGGLQDFVDITRMAREEVGVTDSAFAEVAEAIAFRFSQLKQTAIDTFRTLGEVLAPLARQLLDAMEPFFRQTELEFRALGQLLSERMGGASDAVDEFGNRVKAQGGLISLVLEQLARGFVMVGNVIRESATAAALAISGVEYVLLTVERTFIFFQGAVLGTVEAFQALTAQFYKVRRDMAVLADDREGAAAMQRQFVAAGRAAAETREKLAALQEVFDELGSRRDNLDNRVDELQQKFLGYADSVDDSADALRDVRDQIRDAAAELDRQSTATDRAAQATRSLAQALAGGAGAALGGLPRGPGAGGAGGPGGGGLAGAFSLVQGVAGAAAAAVAGLEGQLSDLAQEQRDVQRETLRVVNAFEQQQQAFAVIGRQREQEAQAERRRREGDGGASLLGIGGPRFAGFRSRDRGGGGGMLGFNGPRIGFDTGGPVTSTGTYRLHQGEFVIRREGVESMGGLGPLLLRMLNQRQVSQSVTFNMPGGGAHLDQQVRALLPELRRHARLALGQGGPF